MDSRADGKTPSLRIILQSYLGIETDDGLEPHLSHPGKI